VVVLPQGLYLGRVIPGRVDEVVDAVREDRIPLELLRGRSSFSMTVQAAQHFVRFRDASGAGFTETSALDGVSSLLPLAEEAVSDTDWRVVLAGPVGPIAVTVRRLRSTAPAKLTCHAPEAKVFPGYSLVGIEVPTVS
jgi:hypothetical protein